MRTSALVCAVVALAFTTGIAVLRGDSEREAKVDRVAGLIKQLGGDQFAKREAASKELEAIGEPALAGLRQAAADSADAEIRARASRLAGQIQDRLDRADFPSTLPPKNALILFDGKNLEGWIQRNGAKPTWKVLDGGIVEVFGAAKFPGLDIMTRQTFDDGYRLHAEFRVPPNANSGIYLQGLYEVQIFDSHGKRPDLWACGSIYGQIDPKVNASKAAGVWQAFDIEYVPAKFTDGRKTRAARVTVVHNGVKIHDFAALGEPSPSGLPIHPSAPGPILLQDHTGPVQFRNIWLVPSAQ